MVDRLRNSEANTRRIQNVEACFGSGRTLLQAGRVLVGEGSLMKMCRFPCSEEVKLDNLEDEGDARYGWLIKTRTKSFVVYAATQGEKEQWMSHIRRCAEELINNGKVPPSDYAALWVPDKEATKCMCCQTSHFTVIQRRHHCRACGKVVCNGCSSKSFVLEGISKKPVRVCDTCYNKLCQGMRTQPIAQAMFGGGGGGQRRDSSRSIAEYGGGGRGGAVDEHAVDSSDSDMEQTEQEEEEGQREQPTFYDSAAAVVVNNNSTPPPLPQRQVEI
uniref:FYVE-type domain-containing protein n=1 Tax=Globodera pallida TaxID=36090 RepID=A0A183BYS2_GLOPA